MRVPFRTLQIVPATTPWCSKYDCLHELLQQPPVAIVPVTDSVGLSYAYDVELFVLR